VIINEARLLSESHVTVRYGFGSRIGCVLKFSFDCLYTDREIQVRSNMFYNILYLSGTPRDDYIVSVYGSWDKDVVTWNGDCFIQGRVCKGRWLITVITCSPSVSLRSKRGKNLRTKRRHKSNKPRFIHYILMSIKEELRESAKRTLNYNSLLHAL